MRYYFIGLLISIFSSFLLGQSGNFSVLLKPVQIENLGGLQSFAHGEYEGKWFIFGGRLDGLHQRQPFATFDIAGHNNQVIMVDLKSKSTSKRSLAELAASLAEPLSSTNIQFYQEGEYLYLIGGYGYSNTEADHTTYSTLTAVHLPTLADAMSLGTPLKDAFRQVKDDRFQVTGGYLGKIDDTYFLVGGQKFIGRYNPMGPDHGPGFIQEYTNAVRRFKITDDGQSMTIDWLDPWIDENAFHRRDYNLGARVTADGHDGLTLFSGVFRKDQDLPFLDCINITKDGYAVQENFNQLFNHYHCAHVPLHDSINNEMHTLFFGGIAQYYLKNEVLFKDDNVPFVKTIAQVSQSADGSMKEVALDDVMPDYLGASAEFFIAEGVPTYKNKIIELNQIAQDSFLAGYIYGGIQSSNSNIFFVNTGEESQASPVIYEVHIRKSMTSSSADESQNISDLNIFPNPVGQTLTFSFNARKTQGIRMFIHDAAGNLIMKKELENLQIGSNTISTPMPQVSKNTLILSISDGVKIYAKKIMQ